VEVIESVDPPRDVARVVARLCGPDEVAPQDVVVLSAHALAKSAAGQSPPVGFSYSEEGAPTGPVVRFASIRGFKGLEASVVVLCELEDLDEATAEQQLYVGLSRAKNHCVIVKGAT
jgi:superfamily I DNA/RNA helicase